MFSCSAFQTMFLKLISETIALIAMAFDVAVLSKDERAFENQSGRP